MAPMPSVKAALASTSTRSTSAAAAVTPSAAIPALSLDRNGGLAAAGAFERHQPFHPLLERGRRGPAEDLLEARRVGAAGLERLLDIAMGRREASAGRPFHRVDDRGHRSRPPRAADEHRPCRAGE